MEESTPAAADDAEEVPAPFAIDTDATFGIDEGEAEELERKWVTWSQSVEEHKRLVLDEVEDVMLGTDDWIAHSPRMATRARRRTEWTQRVVSSCPFFYGYVVAALVAVAALVVSPAQVYCVGIVLDAVQDNEQLSRVGISFLYSAALLVAAPMVMFYTALLDRVSRRTFILLCGGGYCCALMLMALTFGRISLFLCWTLLLVLGPGMLYPCAEGMLMGWWDSKRGKAQAVSQAAGAVLGMIVLPAILSGADSDDERWWRHAYTATGLFMLLPVGVLGTFLLDGGASDHNLRLDDGDDGDADELGGGGGGGGGGPAGSEVGLTAEDIERSGCSGMSAQGVAAAAALAVSGASVASPVRTARRSSNTPIARRMMRRLRGAVRREGISDFDQARGCP